MTTTPKIVVITPIKNEAWILNRFLAVTSQFADHIIIADQSSTDESLSICQRFDKVTLINNESDQYNEADRQALTIEKARELVPGHKILLALDADEILAANAMNTIGWQTMLTAKPGTVFYFERPELFKTPEQFLRTGIYYPLGYMDDGALHTGKEIHSVRVPAPDYAPNLYINDIKILHYAITRHLSQAAKMRRYSVLENLQAKTHVFGRRRFYNPNQDYTNSGSVVATPAQWFSNWENAGIDMQTVTDAKYNWQDYEVLKCFRRYGVRRFWLDNIWDFDWEACRQHAHTQNIESIPKRPIARPPATTTLILRVLDTVYESLRLVRLK